MSVIVHLHSCDGRVVTYDSAKHHLRKKTHDCACQGMKDRATKDQEMEGTPGASRLRFVLDIWKQSQAMTEQAIASAIPSDRPALQRLLQNQTIKISQIEDELFRLAGG